MDWQDVFNIWVVGQLTFLLAVARGARAMMAVLVIGLPFGVLLVVAVILASTN